MNAITAKIEALRTAYAVSCPATGSVLLVEEGGDAARPVDVRDLVESSLVTPEDILEHAERRVSDERARETLGLDPETSKYEIVNRRTGASLGIYEAYSKHEALSDCARDAGYRDSEHAASVAGHAELDVIELD